MDWNTLYCTENKLHRTAVWDSILVIILLAWIIAPVCSVFAYHWTNIIIRPEFLSVLREWSAWDCNMMSLTLSDNVNIIVQWNNLNIKKHIFTFICMQTLRYWEKVLVGHCCWAISNSLYFYHLNECLKTNVDLDVEYGRCVFKDQIWVAIQDGRQQSNLPPKEWVYGLLKRYKPLRKLLSMISEFDG